MANVDIVKSLQAIRESTGWVSVTERLPEIGRCVLIGNAKHGFVGEAVFLGDGRPEYHNPDRLPVFADPHDKARAAVVDPTHWMPLPSPPGEQGAKSGKEGRDAR